MPGGNAKYLNSRSRPRRSPAGMSVRSTKYGNLNAGLPLGVSHAARRSALRRDYKRDGSRLTLLLLSRALPLGVRVPAWGTASGGQTCLPSKFCVGMPRKVGLPRKVGCLGRLAASEGQLPPSYLLGASDCRDRSGLGEGVLDGEDKGVLVRQDQRARRGRPGWARRGRPCPKRPRWARRGRPCLPSARWPRGACP